MRQRVVVLEIIAKRRSCFGADGVVAEVQVVNFIFARRQSLTELDATFVAYVVSVQLERAQPSVLLERGAERRGAESADVVAAQSEQLHRAILRKRLRERA